MGSIAHPVVEPHLKDSSFNVPTASYPPASAAPLPSDPSEIKTIAGQAIYDLNSTLQSKLYTQLGSLFLKHTCYWRDHLGLTNTQFVTLNSADGIVDFITQHPTNEGRCAIRSFELENGKEPQLANLDPQGHIRCIQAFIVFETEHAKGRGVVTLLQDAEDRDEWKVFNLFTSLSELKAAPWKEKEARELYGMPHGLVWSDWRDERREFAGESPAVLVVGAGHSGLMIAARLKMLGVEALVIDKCERVGDSWRKRYHRLVLHDPLWMNAMPYFAYPAYWPIYASKDKMADFLESYASALELNVWNQTEVIQSSWDKKGKQWTVVLERIVNGGRVRRTLCPRHLIQATGLNGEPRIPTSIPGFHTFLGKSRHSTEFHSATTQDAGKKVIVVGTGVSGHDVAHDFHRNGAHVTLIQRSPNYVLSLSTVLAMLKTRYGEGKITEDSDLLMSSMPATVFNRIGEDASRLFQKHDQHVLDGLTKAGFALDNSHPSILSLTIHRAGGFYIDAGTSSLIASGAIAVKQARGIAQIKPRSIILEVSTDGEKIEEEIEADEIFFATGYENGRVRTRKIFGDEIADSIDTIWGFNSMGEIRGVWRRSGHEGFWVAAGSFWLSRYYSKLLALQIKMVEMGLVEP